MGFMKRRLLQIHLLTALAGMVCASDFMWANLTAYKVDIVEVEPVGGSEVARLSLNSFTFMGWPMETTGAGIASNYVRVAEGVVVESQLPPAIMPTVPLARVEKIKKSRVLGRTVLTLDDVRRQDPSLEKDIPISIPSEIDFPSWDANFYWGGIVINAAVGLMATLAVMVGVEWLLRRRERAKV
jgi:hypothetical protein